jgi:hypothetical protein
MTVVCAAVCLDQGCMQMAQELKIQRKGDIVDGSVMVEIVKVRKKIVISTQFG